LLHGCVNPDLRIEDKSATGVIADRATDVKIQALSATIEEIAIVATAEKNDAPRLRVRGRAQASSMQQDKNELLPTRVGEAMDLPYAQRGIALIILGFALFVAFKVVDRTLGVLLEYFFPKV
jgi:transcriptional regulatory protein LevR